MIHISVRWASILLAGVIAASAIPMSTANTIEVKIGQNRSFSAGELDIAVDFGCLEAECATDLELGFGRGGARIVDSGGGSEVGERGVGWRFNLVKACIDQSTSAPMRLYFMMGYDFETDASPGSLATAEATVRAKQGHDGTSAGAVGSSGIVHYNLTSVAVGEGAYQAIGAGRASVQVTDDPDKPGDFAEAVAKVSPLTLQVHFADTAPPEISESRIEPAGLEAAGLFLGYSNAAQAEVYARATDPDLVTGQAVAESCVRDIHFQANSQTEVVPVDEHQGERKSSTIFSSEGRQDITIFGRDWANNQPSQPDAFHFVLDRVAPTVAVGPSPAQGAGFPHETTGKRWYANTTPQWELTCTRDPNNIGTSNTAPCRNFAVSDDGSVWRALEGIGIHAYESIPDGSAQQVTARVADAAANVAVPVDSPVEHVDTVKPQKTVERSNASIYGNGWHRRDTTVYFNCTLDATSGCGMREVSVDGGSFLGAGTHGCATGQDTWDNVTANVWDKAGNLNTTTIFFGCDFLPPPTTTVTHVSEAFYNTRTERFYSDASVEFPVIGWSEVFDAMDEDGVASGIHQYELEIDYGGTGTNIEIVRVSGSQLSYDLEDAIEGNNCVRVMAVDRADNKAEWSEPFCIWVDRILPSANIFAPPKVGLTVYGTNYGIDESPAPELDRVTRNFEYVVVGEFLTGVRATDGGSLLNYTELIEDIAPRYLPTDDYMGPASFDPEDGIDVRHDHNNTYPGCLNLDASVHTCAWLDKDLDANDIGPIPRWLFGRVWDNANNLNMSWRNYVRVRTSLLETECNAHLGSSTCTTIFFAKAPEVASIDPATFVKYIVYGAPIEVEIDTANALHLVGTSTNINAPSVVDLTHRTPGQRYHYKIVIDTTGADIDDAYPQPWIEFENDKGHMAVEWIEDHIETRYG